MTSEEKSRISDLNKCNFTEMSEYFKVQSEARKQMSKEEKQVRFAIRVSLHYNNLQEQIFRKKADVLIE